MEPNIFDFNINNDKPIVVSLVAIHNIYIPVKNIIIEFKYTDNIEKYIYKIIQNNSHIINKFKKFEYKIKNDIKFNHKKKKKKSNHENDILVK